MLRINRIEGIFCNFKLLETQQSHFRTNFLGQQRRIAAVVKPVSNSGMLPIICESIQSISVGGPCVRSELQKPLDSYQEDDLNRLRQRWGDALAKRKEVFATQLILKM